MSNLVARLRSPLAAGLLVTRKTHALFIEAADEIDALRAVCVGLQKSIREHGCLGGPELLALDDAIKRCAPPTPEKRI